LLVAHVCVSVFVALTLHGCGNTAPGTCEGTFKSSQGADVTVTYNPAQGRMGASYACQSTKEGECFFVQEIHHELNCTDGKIKVKPEGTDDWQSSPAGTVQGACECADGEAQLATGACEGTFKSSQGANVTVTYNPAQGRMGAKHTCQSKIGCEYYFVPEIHHDYKCTDGEIKVKAEGKDDWQNSPDGTLEGACECANGETEKNNKNSVVGGGFLQHLPTTVQSWKPAAVVACSIVGMLAVAVSRRVQTERTFAPLIQSSAE